MTNTVTASVGKTGRDHAIVMGGSIAGLAAARVLSDHFREVILVERDRFSAVGEHRRGVPQGRHTHGLLAGGLRALEGFALSMTLVLITAAAGFAQNYAQTNLVSNPAAAACVTVPQLDSPGSTSAIHARIRSTPSGADIFVDGTYVGTTPLDIGLACCFHDVSITKSGLKRWTGRIRNNGHPNINVHLQK